MFCVLILSSSQHSEFCPELPNQIKNENEVDQVKPDPKEKKKEENIWLAEEKKGGTS